MRTKLKASFHIHSTASFDGYNSSSAIYRFARRAQLDVIAITDHDTIKGAVEFEKWLKEKNKKDLTAIIGEEITCVDGTHIIGLFLEKHIDSDTPVNVVNKILDQKGLVYFPHPTRKDGIFNSEDFEKVIDKGHFLEIFNAKINDTFNISAQEIFIKYPHLIPIGGSDAHYNSDILKCYNELNIQNEEEDLKNQLIKLKTADIAIFGKKKKSGSNNYFQGYYKYKEKLNLPQFLREIGKKVFPLYKNFKERKTNHTLESIFKNESQPFNK
ncbi:PHP domain-containing protein [Flavobacteriaceae bacterium R38]|nr:PHP domain-containing protein [Flavobacteriaceae bacterium R38]